MKKSPIILVTLRPNKFNCETQTSWGTANGWQGRVSLPPGFNCDLVESNVPIEGLAYLTKLTIESEDGHYTNPLLCGDGGLDLRTINRLGLSLGPCEPNTFLAAEGTWGPWVPCPYVGGYRFDLSLVLRGRLET